MKKSGFLLAVLIVSLFSCSETEEPQPDNRPFVPGEVVLGIHRMVSIREVFELMNAKKVFIDQMNGFHTYSTLPNDQLDNVITALTDKPYLNKRGQTGGDAYVTGSRDLIMITDDFFEMDEAAQQDWLQTEATLQLKDVRGEFKNLVIKVPPGKEKYFVWVFNKYRSVKWAKLNYYEYYTPY